MIDRINHNQISQVEQANKRETADFGAQFEECLNQALGQAQESNAAEAVMSTPPLTNIQEILIRESAGDLFSMEKTLDLMDRLSAALEDPEATSDSLAPLIRDLDNQAQGLMSEADSLSPGDQARSLLEETAVTAMVQVSKYQRGDFF